MFAEFIYVELFRERLSEKMCMQQSQKVTWDMNDQYTVPDTVAVEPTFVDFLYHLQSYFLSFFKISLKNSELKTTHNTFWGCRMYFI